jgi:hypothetical protein
MLSEEADYHQQEASSPLMNDTTKQRTGASG